MTNHHRGVRFRTRGNRHDYEIKALRLTYFSEQAVERRVGGTDLHRAHLAIGLRSEKEILEAWKA